MISNAQRYTYETLAHLGPEASAVLVGFAVLWLGKLYLTPAGERYLSGADAPKRLPKGIYYHDDKSRT